MRKAAGMHRPHPGWMLSRLEKLPLVMGMIHLLEIVGFVVEERAAAPPDRLSAGRGTKVQNDEAASGPGRMLARRPAHGQRDGSRSAAGSRQLDAPADVARVAMPADRVRSGVEGKVTGRSVFAALSIRDFSTLAHLLGARRRR